MITDIADKKTLENARLWKEQVDAHTMDNDGEGAIPMVLAPNKCDLLEGKEESELEEFQRQEYLDAFASKNGFEAATRISAKTGGNITNAFSALVHAIIV